MSELLIIRVVEFSTTPQQIYPLDADEAFSLPSGVIKKGGDEAWAEALEKLRACPSLAVGGTSFTVKGEAKECLLEELKDLKNKVESSSLTSLRDVRNELLNEGTFIIYPDGYSEESICSLKELICSPRFKGRKYFIYEVDVYD